MVCASQEEACAIVDLGMQCRSLAEKIGAHWPGDDMGAETLSTIHFFAYVYVIKTAWNPSFCQNLPPPPPTAPLDNSV